MIIGVIAVSGAVIAALYQPDANDTGTGDPDTDGTVSDGTVVSDFRTEWEHTFPTGYSGPVWITVTTPRAEPCTLTITWGPWQREILHADAESITYHFRKDNPNDSVPIVVTAQPAAGVTFGTGPPPIAAIDVNEGWERAEIDDPNVE